MNKSVRFRSTRKKLRTITHFSKYFSKYRNQAISHWRKIIEKILCAQARPTLYNPLSEPSVHGTFQARILKWVAISYSRGSSRPKDRTHVSCFFCICRQILYHWTTWEARRDTIIHELLMTFIEHKPQFPLHHLPPSDAFH